MKFVVVENGSIYYYTGCKWTWWYTERLILAENDEDQNLTKILRKYGFRGPRGPKSWWHLFILLHHNRNRQMGSKSVSLFCKQFAAPILTSTTSSISRKIWFPGGGYNLTQHLHFELSAEIKFSDSSSVVPSIITTRKLILP